MSQDRSFTLIGNFTDNISPKITAINSSLDGMRRTMQSFSNRRTGFNSVTASIGKVVASYKHLSAEQRTLRGELRQTNDELRQHSVLINRITRSIRSYNAAVGRMSGGGRGGNMDAQLWRDAQAAALRYERTLNRIRGGRGGGPPSPPGAGGGGGGGRGGGGRGSVLGEVIGGGLITNAIVSGFYQGTQFFRNAVGTILGAFAERAKDQLEDIASAGGIFSAAKFGGAKGLPATFQGAMEMQDDINKSMATIASALPGTTQDYVMNARRMTDTLGQVMTKDTKNFEALAAKLSGQIGIQGAKAFEVVNVETAKATTLLEKLNPTRTVVPMTQIVEDMMKSEKVSVGGLRRYVSFRRATTFEAALTRNLEGLNKAGAGTADRLGAIIKTLKEAVPPELITAMTTSVKGVMEGFKSALFDPDVGFFGLSRTLSDTIIKYNKETGEIMRDKLGRPMMEETTNFFKIFADIFGNLGNLLNSAVLPGIVSLHNPFEQMSKALLKLRDFSFEVFKAQQEATTYYSQQAEKYGMSTGMFKSGEKGGVVALMKILEGFDMISTSEFDKILAIMKKKAPAEQIEKDMQGIYSKLIPAIMKSPAFTKIGMVLGQVLGNFLTGIATLMGSFLHGTALPSGSAFIKSFADAGGFKAMNDIIVYIAEIIARAILEVSKALANALLKSLLSGNFAAAAVLAAPLMMIPGVRAAAGAGIMGLMGRGGRGGAGGRGGRGGRGPRITGDLEGGGVGGFFTTARQTRTAGRIRRFTSARSAPYLQAGSMLAAFGKGALRSSLMSRLGMDQSRAFIRQRGAIGGLARGATRLGRYVPGGALAMGGLDAAIRMSEGQSAGKAIGGAIASTVGATIGGIVGQAIIPIPGVGAVLGSIAGSVIGDKIGNFLMDPTNAQGRAAEKQKEAAQMQLDAANRKASVETLTQGLGVTDASIQFGSIKELQNRLTYLGYGSNQAAQALVKEYAERNVALEKMKAVAIEYERVRQIVANTKTPSEDQKRNLKSLNDALYAAKVKYEREQAQLTTRFAETPKKITDAITRSITSGMTTTEIDRAVASVIARKNYEADNRSTYRTREQALRDRDVVGSVLKSGGRYGVPQEYLTPYNGHIGDAISTEMRHMPAGAKLAIANSSETIIPAAEGNAGFGMSNFVAHMATMARNTGASNMILNILRNSVSQLLSSIGEVAQNTAESISTMKSGAMRVKFIIGGTGGTGGPGAVDAFNPIAASYGLQITSGYRPGDSGYHGVNRARDYSNSTGPTPQMMEFATFMAAAFGGDLAELIYTPLGFSIKNGQVTLPMAADSHYNHVHVAYALGAKNPALFSSEGAAADWEERMSPKYASIRTVTANSSEGFGGGNTINAPISIYQQPGQDPEELASIVLTRLSLAVESLSTKLG